MCVNAAGLLDIFSVGIENVGIIAFVRVTCTRLVLAPFSR